MTGRLYWHPVRRCLPRRLIYSYLAQSWSGSRRVIGLLEQAHQGTLYLHEICNLPLETQAKLVRAVTEQRFKRVGGVVDVAVDVRIISASRRDLSQAIADKTLLEDLYYRLSVVTLIVPSLRERREDIAPLVKYFAQLSAEQFGKPVPKFGDDLLNAMRAYDWPGSVLQLRNIVESMVILNDGSKDNILGLMIYLRMSLQHILTMRIMFWNRFINGVARCA